MKNHLSYLLLGLFGLGIASCNNDGCIDPTALNYDPNAEKDDGSCVYLAQNLNFNFVSKMGSADFLINSEVQLNSGRKLEFTRAQMYLCGFRFMGSGGTYQVEDPYLLLKTDQQDYNLGYLPVATYDGFSFIVGVDSASNHMNPTLHSSDHALSSSNPDHMHWDIDQGYAFIVLEGVVDTSVSMNGNTNADFRFHIGLDSNLVDMAFVKEVQSVAEGVTVGLEVDWLALLDGLDMSADSTSRFTRSWDNPNLADEFVSNVDDAFSLQ
ncbi:MAG: hypothetical protein QF371_01970 [Flavobacteriales bacterium]|nr:hypothetical protein [Flavobacteriales bacterium]